MQCYECSSEGMTREAIGVCHHCSAGLCAEHACFVSDPLTARHPIAQTVVLPRRARVLLCPMCKNALEQPRLGRIA